MSERNVLFMCALSDASKFCYANMSSVEWIKMPGECKCPTNECKCWPGWTAKCPRPGWRFFCFSTNRLNCDLWVVVVGYSSYLVILVFDSKSLSQVPEHLGAVLLKFELSRKILSEEQRCFVEFPIFSSSLTSRFPHKFWQRGCVMRNCVINRAARSRLIFRPDRSIVHPPSLSYQNK